MTLDAVDAAVRGVGLTPMFQPVVSLPDGALVGFEALARWPSLGDPNPVTVFARAKDTGLVDQLDQLCTDTSISTALDAGLDRNIMLFVNSEPTARAVRRSENGVLARGHAHLQLTFELTERSLLEHPRALLRKVAALRADGFAIALDDVGAHPDSLALLDVINPDVVKLDLALVQFQPGNEQARTLSAVLAHHERTGAVVVAEGIETDRHLEQALAWGASLGQGHRFGHAEPLNRTQPAAAWSLPDRKYACETGSVSPFELARVSSPVRTARLQVLIEFCRHIENQAHRSADPPMLLTALRQPEYFTGEIRRQYRDLAAKSPLVAIFGQHLPADLGEEIRGIELEAADPLRSEWLVLTLGPHTAAALVAREHEDNTGRPDGDRRFDFVITYDRTLVTAAARSLLHRMP